ncbi:MAG: arginine decarboxylase, partial [Verrucomicrobiota bacterium]
MSDPNAAPTAATDSWSPQSSRTLYNIDRWGAGYFDINAEGHAVATPLQNGVQVDITDLVADAKARGLKFPLLIRFQDILRHRVQALNDAFRASISEFGYKGRYRGVFPIK